jgi:hypothetical protein
MGHKVWIGAEYRPHTCEINQALGRPDPTPINSHVGLVGGMLTIAGMLIAANWYERHQKRKAVEILPPEAIDNHFH